MYAGALIADRYRLLEQLPAVPPRVLWRARDEWSGQLFSATRVPMSGLVEQEILLARYGLSREVRAVEGCRHRHVVRPTDAVLDADDLWVVSESMPETTLAGVLAQHSRVEPEQAARWGRDIADALSAAHGAGVLHRDLHAAVVGLAEDGAAVVGGFAATVVTPVGLGEGIPLHVAPEVVRGAPASPAADVFALAAMLYIAVEGSGPYPAARDRTQLLHAAAAGVIAPPQRAGQVSGLLVQMLHPDPTQRPSPAAVRDLLAQLIPAQGSPEVWASPTLIGPLAPGARQLPPPRSPPGATSRCRPALIAVGVLGGLALVGGLIAALVTLGDAAQPGKQLGAAPPSAPAAPTSPRSLIDDPQTVDPCSLMNVESLTRFGPATLYSDYGEFPSCGIQITVGDTGSVLLVATFAAPTDDPLPGTVEAVGDLEISREPAVNDFCYRTIRLADGYRVYVAARAFEGAVAELCGIADAGTTTAASALTTRNLRSRATTEPPNSLRYVDACSLLDATALTQVPEVDAARRDPGFGGWDCEWGRDPAFVSPPSAHVVFWRSAPLTEQPTQISDRSAVVTPRGFSDEQGTCVVELVHRSYTGESGQPRVETVDVEVSLGTQRSAEAACQAATKLAAVIAARLPPAS